MLFIVEHDKMLIKSELIELRFILTDKWLLLLINVLENIFCIKPVLELHSFD